MEISIFLYCIVFNCVIILSYLDAKSVSLNDLIAIEEKKILTQQTKPTKGDPVAQPSSLNEIVTQRKTTHTQPLKLKKPETVERINRSYLLRKRTGKSPFVLPGKNISTLKKIFKIKSPLKTKRIKYINRLNNKLRNQTTKRDTYQHAKINEKYIPMLRHLGLLFDNILRPDSSETESGSRENYENFSYSDKSDEILCPCASKKDTIRSYDTKKKAVTTSRFITTKVTTSYPTAITSAPTFDTTIDNFSTIRWNKNIPLLLAGDTVGFRRNSNRFSKRGRSSHNGSLERYITRDYGDHEHHTKFRKNDSNTKDNEEDSYSTTRHNASSDRPTDRARGIRNDTRAPDRIGQINITEQLISSKNKTFESITRHLYQHQGEVQFEIRRDKTESTGVLSKSNSRLQKCESNEKSEPLQTTKYYADTVKEPHANTIDQRFSSQNGPIASKVQRFRGTNEAMTLGNSTIGPSPVDKYVMIFDGYSVARDVNGDNTLTEQAINIHS